MSDRGEVFVTIDTSQLEALRGQLQGTGGGGVEGDANPPIGDMSRPDGYYIGSSMDPSQWGGEGDWNVALRANGYNLDSNIIPDGGDGGFGGGSSGGGLIYAIPRPLRTVIGASIPGGYQAVREYNVLRWGQRGLNALEKADFDVTSMSGGELMMLAAAPILIGVQLKQLYDQYQSQIAAMKRNVERQTGINGDTYDRWLKIQSDPLLRRNI